MKFVVTGAGGFLGSHLVYYLLTSTDHEVVAVSSQSREALEKKLNAPWREQVADLQRLTVVTPTELLEGATLSTADVVVNAGFPWNRGGLELAKGLRFHQQLFEKAATAEVPTFLNISSQSVYVSDRTEPATEESPIDCDTPYATAKYALELMAESILPESSLINVRLGSLIGPGYDIRIVNRFVKQALAGRGLEIYDGARKFSFLDVNDASRALADVGERGNPGGASPLNLGATGGVSIDTIGGVVGDVVSGWSGAHVTIENLPSAGEQGVSYEVAMQKWYRLFPSCAPQPLENTVREIMRAMTSGTDESAEEEADGEV